MDPLKQAAAEEKAARQKLRPASKVLAEINKMSAADRQKRIIESTLRRVASDELTRSAMCIINAPKLRAGASEAECKELVRKALLQDPVYIKTGGSRKGVTKVPR